MDQRLYWSRQSSLDPLAAVLDDKDKRGRKNLYIHTIHISSLKKYVKEGRILDFGCGTGRVGKALKNQRLHFIGCDITEEMLKCAKKFFPCFLFDGKSLPLKEKSFDFFLSVYVLQHIEWFEDIIEEAFKILQKGGHFIAIEQTSPAPYIEKEKDYIKIMRTPRDYEECLSKKFTLLHSYPIRECRKGIFNLFLE